MVVALTKTEPKGLVDSQCKRDIWHERQHSIRPIAQLKRELLRRHGRQTDIHVCRHRDVEYRAKRRRDDGTHLGVVSAFRAYGVHCGKGLAAQIKHIYAQNADIAELVAVRRLGVRMAHHLSRVCPSRDGEWVRAGDAHRDVSVIVNDGPSARRGRRQSTLDRRSESSAVVIRRRDGNRVRSRSDL